jgi:hypothetical protein
MRSPPRLERLADNICDQRKSLTLDFSGQRAVSARVIRAVFQRLHYTLKNQWWVQRIFLGVLVDSLLALWLACVAPSPCEA